MSCSSTAATSSAMRPYRTLVDAVPLYTNETGFNCESSSSPKPPVSGAISCLKRSDEVRQVSLSVFFVTSLTDERQTAAAAAPVFVVRPLMLTVPTTESVRHGEVVATPTREFWILPIPSDSA